jgi:hypothetical protein
VWAVKFLSVRTKADLPVTAIFKLQIDAIRILSSESLVKMDFLTELPSAAAPACNSSSFVSYHFLLNGALIEVRDIVD